MTIKELVAESNRIEGILREPTLDEIKMFKWFLKLNSITIYVLQTFVAVCQPDAELRDSFGLDVRISNHIPPKGGLTIQDWLKDLLNRANHDSPYEIHQAYEKLHPFTDCNGRSGRMLWYWMMKNDPMAQELGFLHCWYYQSLENS